MNIKTKLLVVVAFAGMIFGLFLSSRPVAAMGHQKAYGNEGVINNATTVNVPFKGVLRGNDTDVGFTDTTVTVDTNGKGIATQLGLFSFSQEVTVDITNGIDGGSAHWVAANGDSIDVSIVGLGIPVDTPDGLVFDITETDTITGGTGRFEGSEGSFTVERVASPDTFRTSGSFDGTISSPGAGQ